MSKAIVAYRVFVASPGGLQNERKAFRRALEQFNEQTAIPRGVLFQPVGWEDTLGGVGRPQEIINDELRDCDCLVMILWDRWGSHPAKAGSTTSFTSGTEEEFHVAKDCFASKNSPMQQIVILFKAVDSRQLSDPGEELKKVLAFRRNIESSKEHLYHSFDDLESFEGLLNKFLNRWLMNHEQRKGNQQKTIQVINNTIERIDIINDAPISHEGMPLPELVVRAQVLAEQGRFTDAESLFARAAETSTTPQALKAYAEFLAELGRLTQAQAVFERLVSTSGKGEEFWKATGYNGLGKILLRRNRLAEAEEKFRGALKIAEAIDDPVLRAYSLSHLAYVMSNRKEFDEAEALLAKSASIFESKNHKPGLARIKNLLGELYRMRGNLEQAAINYKDSLILFRELKMESGIATALNNVALVHIKRNELSIAEATLREALTLNNKLNRIESIALNHRNLGQIQEMRGNRKEAKAEYQRAFELYSSLGLSQRAGWIKTKISGMTAESGGGAARQK